MSLTKLTSDQIYQNTAFTVQTLATGNSSVNLAINSTSVAINGSVGLNGQILTSNGSATYWSSTSGSGISTGKAIAMAIVFGG